MTPEERFTKIENILATVAEHQAKHAEEMAELREAIGGLRGIQKGGFAELRALHKGMVVAISKVAEQQRHTEEKLNILIDTVDRTAEMVTSEPVPIRRTARKDVCFVRLEKLTGGQSPEDFGEVIPDLVMEVLSLSDRMRQVADALLWCGSSTPTREPSWSIARCSTSNV